MHGERSRTKQGEKAGVILEPQGVHAAEQSSHYPPLSHRQRARKRSDNLTKPHTRKLQEDHTEEHPKALHKRTFQKVTQYVLVLVILSVTRAIAAHYYVPNSFMTERGQAEKTKVIHIKQNHERKHARRPKHVYKANSPGVPKEKDDIDNVLWTLAGHWHARKGCEKPRLLLVLYGQIRAFKYTHESIAKMSNQASHSCFFAIAVADESICDPNLNRTGACRGVKGTELWWDQIASDPHDAARVINSAAPAFQGGLFATVYQSQNIDIPYWYKMKLWGERMRGAIHNVIESFEQHGQPLDLKSTVVIRSRFDMLPQTYPVFPWDKIQDYFFHDRQPIVYLSEIRDCQPDMHAYTSLEGMVNHFSSPFQPYLKCSNRSNINSNGILPIVMDDEWMLCRKNLLRTNLEVTIPEEGLIPIPVGIRPRLYCKCVPPVYSDAYDCVLRPWYGLPFLLSSRTIYECPDIIPGTQEKIDTAKCVYEKPNTPLGCTKLPCPI